MSMLTRIKALAEAIGADIKALRNDSRFSDAREWTATTVTQAEAEAGASTARRAWTSQRVRQAIAAWWGGASSVTPAASKAVVSGVGGKINSGFLDAVGSGKVMLEGAYGFGSTGNSSVTLLAGESKRAMNFSNAHAVAGTYGYYFGMMDVRGYGCEIAIDYRLSQSNYIVKYDPTGAGSTSLHLLYTDKNTTKSPDGTLKASSPVINLFTDKIELHNEDQFGATPQFTRKSKGVYEITGTLGLRSEGWYLDTPSDRNGNKYFNVEWTQNVTPEATDGVVDTYRDDIVVTIETFERVWNPATGLHENGAHVDINDMQDRFVQLRFNEIKPADIDDGEYMPPAEGSEPDAPRVPRSVTMRQARLVLLGAGLLDQVGIAIDMLEEPQRSAARIEWDYASKVDRDSQMVMLIGDALNLNSAELDALFIAAHAID